MLASFEQTFRLQQRDADTKESKDMVLESDNIPLRRSPLLFHKFVITRFYLPAKYECQAPKIWVPRDQPVSGSSP